MRLNEHNRSILTSQQGLLRVVSAELTKVMGSYNEHTHIKTLKTKTVNYYAKPCTANLENLAFLAPQRVKNSKKRKIVSLPELVENTFIPVRYRLSHHGPS